MKTIEQLKKHISQRIKDIESANKMRDMEISNDLRSYQEGRIHELQDLLNYLEGENA